MFYFNIICFVECICVSLGFYFYVSDTNFTFCALRRWCALTNTPMKKVSSDWAVTDGAPSHSTGLRSLVVKIVEAFSFVCVKNWLKHREENACSFYSTSKGAICNALLNWDDDRQPCGEFEGLKSTWTGSTFFPRC